MESEERINEIENQIPLYVGGDLEPAQMEEVERLLERSPRARELVQRARAARRAYAAAAADDRSDPPELWGRIREILRAEGAFAERPEVATEQAPVDAAPELTARVAGRVPRWLGWGGALATAAALTLFALFAYGPFGARTAGPGPAPAELGPGPVAGQPDAAQPVRGAAVVHPTDGVRPTPVERGLRRATLVERSLAEEAWLETMNGAQARGGAVPPPLFPPNPNSNAVASDRAIIR